MWFGNPVFLPEVSRDTGQRYSSLAVAPRQLLTLLKGQTLGPRPLALVLGRWPRDISRSRHRQVNRYPRVIARSDSQVYGIEGLPLREQVAVGEGLTQVEGLSKRIPEACLCARHSACCEV